MPFADVKAISIHDELQRVTGDAPGGLAGPRGRQAIQAIQAQADAGAADIAPIIAELKAADATSLEAMAAALSEKRIPTSRGNRTWSATQVKRLLNRLTA
jgi:hypothetical protein